MHQIYIEVSHLNRAKVWAWLFLIQMLSIQQICDRCFIHRITSLTSDV